MKRKKKILSNLCNETVMPALYWLYKEEVANSKLNSLLEPVEFIGVEEVEHLKKQSGRVLRAFLLILGSQLKEKLLKRFKKFPFLGFLIDEVNDIANIEILVKLFKFHDE